MTDEQRKEICKSYFYDFSIVQIAEIENISDEEVVSAINWGKQNDYFEDLNKRGE